ncbi:MAG TPA: SDR family oxidoreductase [Gemmatimonadaceae bacterium]|nr:SDR family oxidoreductase [Gemmatimonadaceae bacterium]
MILVTGATGYIGGRLVPRLLADGHRVRCMVRDPSRLKGRPWHASVEVVAGDVLEQPSLREALDGVSIAYYLIHSMGAGAHFEERDLVAARNFSAAAKAAGVRRIIYLGGLADPSPALSDHLRSRQQTGEALREAGVPVTEFRAGVIVGSNSLSFEMIRYLTERVPIMICPRWVYTRTQPIGIADVLDYLVASISVPASTGRIVEIGGADIITYGEMMTTYADVRGLKRWLVPVPFLTPRLSSLWVNLVTPIPASMARPLVEGLRNENVVNDPAARQLFPDIVPAGYRQCVELALDQLEASKVESSWSDALSTSQRDAAPVTFVSEEGMLIEHRQRVVSASAAEVFRVFSSVGGTRGWLYMNAAWKLRGFVDRLIGGVGLRRGRRDPDRVRAGDALDFWRVEAVEQDKLLRLRAEMKLPGLAWLQFRVTPRGDGSSLLEQTAFFAPKGLAGTFYWYGLYPIHRLIFSGLIDRIADRASLVGMGRSWP